MKKLYLYHHFYIILSLFKFCLYKPYFFWYDNSNEGSGGFMNIIIVSDSHGKNSRLEEMLAMYPNADMYLHCGDIETDEDAYPQFITVCGNNDYSYMYPDHRVVEAKSHRILIIHGNQSLYTRRLKKLASYAQSLGCDIVCYGHSHVADLQTIDGVMLINPGSLWRSRDGRGPSYAIMDINEEGNVHVEIKFIE